MTSNELEIFKQSILDDVRVMMQTTGQVTQYIGARYVPLFADPLEWSNTKEYEPLTIVTNKGNSYTSRQFVPKGVDISDTSFWAITGNYNAQIEQYRKEVAIIKSELENKAPINHATDSAEYGIGNEVNYGHLKLASDDTPLTSDSNSGIAAPPKMVRDLISKEHPNDVIVLGDSFSDAAYLGFTAWPSFFEQFTGMKTHNFAKANAGFNRDGTDGKNFLQQLVTANSDPTIVKSSVKYVILYGGYNDVVNGVTPSQCQSAATQIAENVAANYPNAKLIVCLCTFGHRDTLEDKFVSFSKQVGYFFKQYNATVISNAYAWLIGQPNDYTRDELLHPSEKGEKFIARLMTEAIHGSWNASAFFEIDFANAYFSDEPDTKLNLNHSGPASVKIENGIINISIYSFDWPTVTDANAYRTLKVPVTVGDSNFKWNDGAGFGVICKTVLVLHGSYPNITGRSEYRTGYFNGSEISLPLFTEGTGINTALSGDFVQAVKVL